MKIFYAVLGLGSFFLSVESQMVFGLHALAWLAC